MVERAPTPRTPAPPVQGETGVVAARAAAARASKASGRRDPAPWPLSPAGLRRQLLVQLRLDGPSSPDDLAAVLGASRTGILQQLRALEDAGLVNRHAERHGVGRPRFRYDVTPDAQALFPAAYDGLAVGLLTAIVDVGGSELLEDVFAARRTQQANRIRDRIDERVPAGAPLEDRVRELAVIQDEQGYLAQAVFDADGSIRLQERNCAIHRIARDQPAACQAELKLFSEVLGADVVREQHIATGDRCCSYRISEPAAATEATAPEAEATALEA